jgi:hypothetical protein
VICYIEVLFKAGLIYDVLIFITGKIVLMLQSLKRGCQVERNSPQLHVCLLRFLLLSKYP